MPRMHLVYLSREYPPYPHGGIGTYTSIMAHAMAGAGHQVDVVAWTNGKETIEQDGGVCVHRVPPYVVKPLCQRPIRWLHLYERFPALGDWAGWSFAAYRKVRSLAETAAIDVVEAPELYAEGLVAALIGRIPVVVRLHSPAQITFAANAVQNEKDLRLGYQLERWSALRSAQITSPSYAMAQLLTATWRLEQNRVQIVPNPVDDHLFSPPSDRGDTGKYAPMVILFVGRLERNKGAAVLAQAFAQLHARFPHLRLRMLGADNYRIEGQLVPFREFLERQVDRTVIDHIDLAGAVPRSELPAEYRAAALCVIPSLTFENFPYTALEAMACGCCVIGSNCGGIPEMIEDGVTGRVVAPGDVDQLAAALTDLLLSPNKRRALGSAARQRVEQRYARRIVATQMEAIYSSLVA